MHTCTFLYLELTCSTLRRLLWSSYKSTIFEMFNHSNGCATSCVGFNWSWKHCPQLFDTKKTSINPTHWKPTTWTLSPLPFQLYIDSFLLSQKKPHLWKDHNLSTFFIQGFSPIVMDPGLFLDFFLQFPKLIGDPFGRIPLIPNFSFLAFEGRLFLLATIYCPGRRFLKFWQVELQNNT